MKLNFFNKTEYNKKLETTVELIKLWVDFSGGVDKVYVAFSGGVDSTVLLHIARSVYPNITAVFCNTLIEFPEIYKFVRTFDNVIWTKPTKIFQKVIKENGWPVISKSQSQCIEQLRRWPTDYMLKTRLYGTGKPGATVLSKKYRYLLKAPFKISQNCCDYLKKRPVKKYEKATGQLPMLGIMAQESNLRQRENQCNLYENKRPISRPLLKWCDYDIWNYVKTNKLKYCSLYDNGWNRTGCIYCLFGIHMEKGENKIQRMSKTHPKQYKYFLNKLNGKQVVDFMKIPYKEHKGIQSFFTNKDLR